MEGAAYRLLMLAQGRAYDTAIEEDFRSVCDRLKGVDRFFKLIAVVMRKGGDPSLELLWAILLTRSRELDGALRLTCFIDMTASGGPHLRTGLTALQHRRVKQRTIAIGGLGDGAAQRMIWNLLLDNADEIHALLTNGVRQCQSRPEY